MSGLVPDPTAATASAVAEPPIRVLVVDDSAVIRGLVSRALEATADVTVVASASNGEIAVSALTRHLPDVVVLDVEMPVMDGLSALPKLLAVDPLVRVIMCSTLTLRNAEISLRALAMGAVDYIAKPTATQAISAKDFQRELIDKVRTFGAARRHAARARPGRRVAPAMGSVVKPASHPGGIALRAASTRRPELIAIGSSTGGPQALVELFSQLGPDVAQPILVTQHMPATFTVILAAHLARVSGRPCAEAEDGAPVQPGHIHVAPGGFHMLVEYKEGRRTLRLWDGPPENFCKPAVDPMLSSVVAAVGGAVLAVILTGMGNDGLKGCVKVAEAGGTVIAQDEESSVVWGMPGAVANAGLCSAVLPIGDIAARIGKLAASASEQ
jgi:two-component system, chemotaxis family, protein-glutamate methylesterase/glutaminase